MTLANLSLDLARYPPWAFSAGSGRLVQDENGQPVPDERVRIEAIKVNLATHESLRRLHGLDAPKRAEVTHKDAQLDADIEAVLEQLEAAADARALARYAGQLPGDIVEAEVVSDVPGVADDEQGQTAADDPDNGDQGHAGGREEAQDGRQDEGGES
jgi:hypothetical protein